MDLGLRGKKAIVCASSQGLGFACARSLVREGATVFINGSRAGVFGDPFGNDTVAYPCNSVVTGCSKNVFLGCTRG